MKMTKRQHEIIDLFSLGEIGRVEFVELALEAGMSLAAIEVILQDAEEDI